MRFIRTAALSLLILFPIMGISAIYKACKPYMFLKNGLNLNSISLCQYHVKTCPKTGPVYDIKCLKKILDTDPVCSQANKLSAVLNAQIDQLSFEKMGHFILVKQLFPADGQNNYYVLSPYHCLLNTKLDPRYLSPVLRKQHKNTIFIIVNWDKPVYQVNNKGITSFITTLKITKNCLACELIGYAKISYDFDKNGKLVNTRLVSFDNHEGSRL